uniref:IS30 family transposase n=1 Tax=Nocardia stercoris TaxID=2483361 RepID=UPI0018F3A92A|nr:IS30 family transposase [Nocardia stercoris]
MEQILDALWPPRLRAVLRVGLRIGSEWPVAEAISQRGADISAVDFEHRQQLQDSQACSGGSGHRRSHVITAGQAIVVVFARLLPEPQVTPHLTNSLLSLPASMRRTFTWDRSREIAGHKSITAATGTQIYLCKPRSPCQRGTNENTNRLLRQYLPKNADLRRWSQSDLDTIADELNHRPRKVHGYRSPVEVYADHLNSDDALTV